MKPLMGVCVEQKYYRRKGKYGALVTSMLPLVGLMVYPPIANAEEPPADHQHMEEKDSTKRLEEVSVTATRVARPVTAVPESVAIVNKERIASSKMQNIKEALTGIPGVLIDSKNGGYDARLVIRGAGQKAPYGVREITILRDGVPMTDPDSFSRLDFIDTQDIDQIEITKGPGSLYGAGSAGGTIQILSKSVFDTDANNLKISKGTEGAHSYHLRYGEWINDSNAIALTASQRVLDNDWRRWNRFNTTQVSVKHGVLFQDDASLETEVSYSEANLQLPGSMNTEQFKYYEKTGRQTSTQDAWKHSGRYSEIWFFNSKYEKKVDAFTFKPRVYFNHWMHIHPVTGAINDSPENMVYGTDLELNHDHTLFDSAGTLVAGITLRQDVSNGAKKYQYKDVTTGWGGRISSTLSDDPGSLLQTENTTNTLYGFFFQESLTPTDALTIDIGMRVDQSLFDIETNQSMSYDYSSGTYVTGTGNTTTEKNYWLFSPKIGISYALSPNFSIFGSVAQSDQVPSASEIKDNTNLDVATSRNYEVGIKGRGDRWSMDLSVYLNPIENEIISTVSGSGATVYSNAGKTDKRGLEITLGYSFPFGVELGGTYAYSDYTFDSFQEVVNNVAVSRAGNAMPFVPRHQSSLSIGFDDDSGLKARVQSDFWGEYQMDNANSEIYEGYNFLTSVMLAYEKGPHTVMVNVDNATDLRYATEVKKSTRGTKSYYAGSPMSGMLTYTYAFSGSAFLGGENDE
ncbi:MAG: TonB-dependent receptor [Magnetococcales bacterium]|nr:TonB-dependent receptor [Magnetococcales bacterium]